MRGLIRGGEGRAGLDCGKSRAIWGQGLRMLASPLGEDQGGLSVQLLSRRQLSWAVADGQRQLSGTRWEGPILCPAGDAAEVPAFLMDMVDLIKTVWI